MATVSEVLSEKGGKVYGIAPETTVIEAVRTMVEANIGSVLIMDEGSITGIFTERDYLRMVTREDQTAHGTPVADLMSRPVIVIEAGADVDEALALMSDRHIRHLPVVAENRVAGVVSIGDLVKHKTTEQAFQIKYLEDYISAR